MRALVPTLALLTACATDVVLDLPGSTPEVADPVDSETADTPAPASARVTFTELGSAWPMTDGVAMHGTRRSAVIGAFRNTCEVDVEGGDLGIEFDPSPDDETVVDGDDGGGTSIGLRVLTATSAGVQITTYFDGPPSMDAAATIGAVTDARFTDGGVVAAVSDAPGRCAVTWLSDSLTVIDRVPAGRVCQRLAAGADGAVFAAVDDMVWRVDADITAIGSGDLVAYIDGIAVFTAETGGDVVSAWSPDGEPLWRARTEAPILDLVAQSGVALVATGSLSGSLVALDPQTGEEIGRHALVDAPTSLHASDSDLLGITDNFGVRFVSVH